MKMSWKLGVSAVSALMLAPIAFGQQDYVGRYDVYTAYMYLHSSLINLGESGFHTQVGLNPTRWYSMGFDFSDGTGDTTLVPSMFKSSVQQQIAGMLNPLKSAGMLPAAYEPAVLVHSKSQTYATGPQLNYRHFRAVTLFVHPDLGAIHESVTPSATDVIGKALVAQLAPTGVKSDWTYFYGIGGGIDFNITRHVGLRVHADFVRDHLFSDLLGPRNSVRVSVGPTFHMGRNIANQK